MYKQFYGIATDCRSRRKESARNDTLLVVKTTRVHIWRCRHTQFIKKASLLWPTFRPRNKTPQRLQTRRADVFVRASSLESLWSHTEIINPSRDDQQENEHSICRSANWHIFWFMGRKSHQLSTYQTVRSTYDDHHPTNTPHPSTRSPVGQQHNKTLQHASLQDMIITLHGKHFPVAGNINFPFCSRDYTA